MSISMKSERAQIVVAGIIVILVLALVLVGIELFLSSTGTPPVIQGEPQKDPSTGLYPVYILVSGHRDYTILHSNLHANVRLDFVSFYFSRPEGTPSGRSWIDFNKGLHVTVTIVGSKSPSVLTSAFDVSVSLGAHWGQVLTYALPSGSYTIRAQGIDQDGYSSSAEAELNLP
jgi:hypothetical protein